MQLCAFMDTRVVQLLGLDARTERCRDLTPWRILVLVDNREDLECLSRDIYHTILVSWISRLDIEGF